MLLLCIFLMLNSVSSQLCPSKCKCFMVGNNEPVADCKKQQLKQFPQESLLDYKHILFSGNKLTKFEITQQMPNLTYLDLSDNKIKVVGQIRAPNIDTIDLSNNNLEHFPSDVCKLHLKYLLLAKNNLTYELLNGKCLNLEILDLAYNFIDRIPLENKFAPNLNRLDLSDNKINDIDVLFKNNLILEYKNLEYINLRFNNVHLRKNQKKGIKDDELIVNNRNSTIKVCLLGNPCLDLKKKTTKMNIEKVRIFSKVNMSQFNNHHLILIILLISITITCALKLILNSIIIKKQSNIYLYDKLDEIH